MSTGEAALLVAVFRGDKFEPELHKIAHRNVFIMRGILGCLDNRSEVEINVDNQGMSFNSKVPQSAPKSRKNKVLVLVNLHLTGPHGEACQEQ